MSLLGIVQAIGAPKLRRDAERFRAGISSRPPLVTVPTRGSVTTGPLMDFGETAPGRPLHVPMEAFLGHGLISGATGASKTYRGTRHVQQAADTPAIHQLLTPSVLDSKGDLFYRSLWVLSQAGTYPEPLILNFSASYPVPYALLEPRAGESPESLVDRRMDTFEDVLGSDSQMSLRMARMLRHVLTIAVEHQLSFPLLEYLLQHPDTCRAAGQASRSERVAAYFEIDFDRERNVTIPALLARLDFLLRSDVLRMSFAADRAVDLRGAMDAGRPSLVNCGGPTMSRQLSSVIQSLVVSDLRQATFARKERHHCQWLIDEAQNLMASPSDVSALVDILTMARAFGVGVTLLTQSLVAASPSSAFLTQLKTNLKWMIALRSGPEDARLIEEGLGASGRILKRRRSSGDSSYLTETEERHSHLRAIANLPNEHGYVWLRTMPQPAVRVRFQRVVMPPQACPQACPIPEGERVDVESVRRRLVEQQQKLSALSRARFQAPSHKAEPTNLKRVLGRLDAAMGGQSHGGT